MKRRRSSRWPITGLSETSSRCCRSCPANWTNCNRTDLRPTMSTYIAPLRDMRFVMTELADLGTLSSLPGLDEVTPDLADAVLEEAARLAAEVLAPLNRTGDEQG